MATTTNYGWTTPDNSGLVKNGAQDIRTLGSAIDTSLANVGYGNAGKNKIINGGFDFWARGTSFTPSSNSNIFTADRFNGYCTFSAGTYTVSQQAFTAGTAPVAGYEGQYFMRHAFPTSGTISYFEIGQKIEDVRTFAGQTITLSFWAKASSSTSQFTVTFAQNYGSGGSATTYATGAFSPSLTTSWQRFTGTFTVPSISGKTIGAGNFLQLVFYSGGVATSSVFDIWGVQVEVGSTATPFSRNASSIQGELAACQRYYIRYAPSANNYAYFGNGTVNSSTNAYITLPLPVEMRVIPTSIDTTTAVDYRLQYGATAFNVSSLTLGTIGNGTKIGCLSASVASGLTTNGFVQLLGNNNSTAYVGFSAEL